MSTDADQTKATKGGMDRRALLKLGAGALPVLMTLSSRSAFACHSTTPSAFGSICASRPDVLKPLSGKPPSWWANTSCHSYWPSHCRPTSGGGKTAATFKSIFGTNPPGGTSTTTCLSVLNNGATSGSKGVARACVAAYLNACNNYTSSVLPSSAVINIWREFNSKTYFEPTAGIKWYANTPTLPSNGWANPGGTGGIIGYCNTTWT